MRKSRLFLSLLWVIVFMVSSCTIDVAQSTPQAATITAVPTTVGVIMPTPDASPTPLDPAHLPKTKIPVTWAALKLSGRLVFINDGQPPTDPILSVQSLDLATGELTTLYQSPPYTWVYYLAVSPDGKQMAMSYATWDANGNLATETIDQMPLDGSAQPVALIQTTDPKDQYLQPEWSPNGKYLYFSHVDYRTVTKTQLYPDLEIFRMALPNGTPEKIADQAFWPRFSKDGSRLVYISSDIQTGKNKIFVADADGKNAHLVAMSGTEVPDIIDAPIFSPDEQSILFSAPIPEQTAAPTWLERLLGISVVDAHSVPSEWWSVPVAGGPAKQLTNLQYAGLFASNAPDGKHIVSFSTSGIFVMNPDASGVTMIFPDLGGAYGTVSWLP